MVSAVDSHLDREISRIYANSENRSKAEATQLLHKDVLSYDKHVDYWRAMHVCATKGTPKYLRLGALYEQQRNLMIDDLNLSSQKTAYFGIYPDSRQILQAMNTYRMKEQHYIACYVYDRLRASGFNNEVSAGIIGNMMAECGGQTLDLQWWIHGDGKQYYGLCMWDLSYAKDLDGSNVPEQMNYLLRTLQTHMEMFGGSYEYFMSMTDAGDAAKYFNSYYERGAGGEQRASNARVALEWIYGVEW